MFDEQKLITQCLNLWKNYKEMAGVVLKGSQSNNLYSILFQIKPYRFFVTLKFDVIKIRISLVVINCSEKKATLEFYADRISKTDNNTANLIVNAYLFRSLLKKCPKEKTRQLAKKFLECVRKNIKTQFPNENLRKLIQVIKKQTSFPFTRFVFADTVLE